MTGDDALLLLVADARAAELALERGLDLDPDGATRLVEADRRARERLIRALRADGPLRDTDTAAVLPDGTVICVAHQGDGLAIVPAGRVRRVGGSAATEEGR